MLINARRLNSCRVNPARTPRLLAQVNAWICAPLCDILNCAPPRRAEAAALACMVRCPIPGLTMDNRADNRETSTCMQRYVHAYSLRTASPTEPPLDDRHSDRCPPSSLTTAFSSQLSVTRDDSCRAAGVTQYHTGALRRLTFYRTDALRRLRQCSRLTHYYRTGALHR